MTVDEIAASIRGLESSDRESLLQQFEDSRWARIGRALRKASSAFWSVLQHPRVGALSMLGGLAVGFFSYRDANKQAEDLKRISGEISTTHVGIFPHNMDEIIDLINDTDHGEQIMMAVDNLGYGILSNPKKYRELDQAMRDATARGVSIRIVTYDGDSNLESKRRQFRAAMENEEVLQALIDDNATTVREIEKQVKNWGRHSTFEEKEHEAERLLHLLWEAEEKIQADYRGLRNVAICAVGKSATESPYANDPLEIHFWASVDPSGVWKRALFTFKIFPASPAEPVTETTFATRDSRLMSALKGRWDRWEETCEKDWNALSE